MVHRTVARIKKRDGNVSDFVKEKITTAVYKAMQSNGIDDHRSAESVADIVTFILEEKFGGFTIPSVEQIQDIVEMVLMKQGYHRCRQILHSLPGAPQGHSGSETTGINLERLIRDYIEDIDWKIKENSNEGSMSFSGLNARVSGEVMANFALNQIYTENIKEPTWRGISMFMISPTPL